MRALQQSEPAFPIHLSDVAGEFSYLDKTAGEQYDLLRAYLESYDQVLIAKWIESIRDRLENPGSPDLGPAIPSEPDDSWLNDALEAISDFWSSLPAPLRGTLKAIGKAALAVAMGAAGERSARIGRPVELSELGF